MTTVTHTVTVASQLLFVQLMKGGSPLRIAPRNTLRGGGGKILESGKNAPRTPEGMTFFSSSQYFVNNYRDGGFICAVFEITSHGPRRPATFSIRSHQLCLCERFVNTERRQTHTVGMEPKQHAIFGKAINQYYR